MLAVASGMFVVFVVKFFMNVSNLMLAEILVGIFVSFVPYNLHISLMFNHKKLVESINPKYIRFKALEDLEMLAKINCVLIDESFLIDYRFSEVVGLSVSN